MSGDFFEFVGRGDAAAAAGRADEAAGLYEQAAALIPGHALPFTRRATVLFRSAFGEPPPPRGSPPARPVISMSTLGQRGKFGNQLLQYAFLRLYAREYGLVAQAPDWIGRDLFDCDDPPPQGPLPAIDEARADLFGSLRRETPQVYAGTDIAGYFCGSMRRWGARAEGFRSLFVPGRKLRPLLEQAQGVLRRRGRTLVGVHIRRGDFGYGRFWIAPERWYADWLSALWPLLDGPVLYLATDDPQARESFARFAPVGTADLGVALRGAEFFLDHFLLSQADHLAIANSTFSYTAALLNSRARGFARPDPARRALVPFKPWEEAVLLDAPAGGPGERAAITRLVRPNDSVIHVGEFCSPWTNEARAAHPGLRVMEIYPETAIDALWQRGAFETIDHLVIGEQCELQAVLEGARESFDFGRIAALHYRCADPARAEAAARALRGLGFKIRRLDRDGSLRDLPPDASPPPGDYVATPE